MTVAITINYLRTIASNTYFYHPTLTHAEAYNVNLIARQLHNCHWSSAIISVYTSRADIYMCETVNGDSHLHNYARFFSSRFFLFSRFLSSSLRYFPFPYHRSIESQFVTYSVALFLSGFIRWSDFSPRTCNGQLSAVRMVTGNFHCKRIFLNGLLSKKTNFF